MAKIKEAREQLAVLSEKLDTQKVILNKKTTECDQLVETIESSTETANTKKASAEVAAKEIEQQSKVIAVEKVKIRKKHFLDLKKYILVSFYKCGTKV